MSRKTLGKNRLRPLDQRLSAADLQKRQLKIESRRTVAETLIRNLVRMTEPLRRGFFGRMKWFCLGR